MNRNITSHCDKCGEPLGYECHRDGYNKDYLKRHGVISEDSFGTWLYFCDTDCQDAYWDSDAQPD